MAQIMRKFDWQTNSINIDLLSHVTFSFAAAAMQSVLEDDADSQ